jgi:hypothetical protein
MADRASDLIPVVERSSDLCAGLYEPVNRFPRAQRTLLGRVILEDALQMLVLRTVANRRTEKGETLAEASGRLDALRITLRLSKRLGFLSNGGYEWLSGTAEPWPPPGPQGRATPRARSPRCLAVSSSSSPAPCKRHARPSRRSQQTARRDRARRDPSIEARLVELRREGGRRALASSAAPPGARHACGRGAPAAPPPPSSLPRRSPPLGCARAIVTHGSLLRRRLVAEPGVTQLAADIAAAFDAHDGHGAEREAEPFEEAGVGVLARAFLGERPLLAKKWTLRRARPSESYPVWHRDGAFMGRDIHSLNVWLALSAAGSRRPRAGPGGPGLPSANVS